MTDRPPPATRYSVFVSHESDVAVARRRARELAAQQGLSEVRSEALATAVTELARNIVVHARSGELQFSAVGNAPRRGVVVTARDAGPGIEDVEQVMQDGFSTAQGLGLGLPSARRLVDEFEIESEIGTGTTITLRQWTSAMLRDDAVGRAAPPAAGAGSA
ncbi:MAG TPA: anti-sigma regulatory factor [Ideonella sp.]|uniref:anti-sigma regulatory factor n=1 Tax=Ideonella sp. TaxID=1929293 RepID=UPI002BA2EBCC|nr:anti-sigma regulatory factor [Ideonella sp.]HSI51739.1 anti-sigma regulatory factor [Ideonella sp.]